MNSPTGGSTAPVVPDPKTDESWRIVDGVPTGEYCIVATSTTVQLEARIKCSKCETTTQHVGIGVQTNNGEVESVSAMRVYGCTVCGTISTKR